MKSTGMSRKIDELGRIVIPKEIRKNVNIHNGEELDIYVDDRKIILRKAEKFINNESIYSNIASIIKKYLNVDILITNNEYIVGGTINSLCGQSLSNKYLEYINNSESYISVNKESININNYNNFNFLGILPIIIDSNVSGLFIIISNNDINGSLLSSIKMIIEVIICFYDIS